MDLRALVSPLPDKKVLGESNPEILGLAYDSREVRGGFLFAAIRGTRQNGHAYIQNAIDHGASALLLETPVPGHAIPQVVVPNSRQALALVSDFFYHHPTRGLKLVGVTGTNGKTTTTYLCESIFRAAGYKTGIIGTIQYKVGEQTYECKNTTPESLDLFKLFSEMVENKVQGCAMEVSSHALDQGRIFGISFDAVVFTNLTQDHLDYHKDMESYFAAKSKLFTGLFKDKNPKAVINVDDPYGKRLKQQIALPAITYGIHEGDVRAFDIGVDWSGVSFTAKTPAGPLPLKLQLLGAFNTYNALAALATGIALGFSPDTVKQGLESVRQVRGRFEPVRQGQNFAVIVDYAHTPDGLLNLLQSAKKITQGNLIVVFGCGGDRDRGKRPLMGEIAEKYGDRVIVTSDNPRSEEPVSIIREIEAGMKKNHLVEPDRKKAIETALGTAKAEDCVVIAGKGHETYQIFKDKTIHFDDREVAEAFLQNAWSPLT